MLIEALIIVAVAFVGAGGVALYRERRAKVVAVAQSAKESARASDAEQTLRRIVQESIAAQLLYEQEHRLAQIERMASVPESRRPKNPQPGAFDAEQRLLATTQRVHRAYHRMGQSVPDGTLALIEAMLAEVADART